MRCLSVLLMVGMCLVSCARVSSSGSAAAGFRSDFRQGEHRPWTSEAFRNDPAQFQFAVVADRTGGAREGVFEDAVRKLNLLCPEFVINVGDMIEGYNTDRAVVEKMYDGVEALTKGFDMPFFRLPGNHDVEGKLSRAIWNERYGRTYYYFVYRNVLFLCLDSLEGKGNGDYIIGDGQVDYFRKVLRQNAGVRWTFVFLHVPEWKGSKAALAKNGWGKMEQLLKDRPHTVFAGHDHQYAMFERNGSKYIQMATTGGSSNLKGADVGVLDHVMWVTMTDKGPRFANLELSGIHDEKLCTEESLELQKSFDFSVAPIFAEGSVQKGASTLLLLTNRAELPAKVHLALKGTRVVSVKPESIDIDMAAHTSRTIPVSIASAVELKPSLIDPVQITGTATYESKGSGIVRKKVEMSAGVTATMFDMPRAKKAVVVDAKLDEWESLPFTANTKEQAAAGEKGWKGPQDASFRFGVQRDDNFVYIGIEATDDAFAFVQNDPGHVFYTYDGMSVTMDVQPGGAADANGLRDVDSGLLRSWFTPGEPGRAMFMLPGNLKPLPKGSKVACIRTATGYVLEMAVPVAYIERFQGVPWKGVEINVQMVDADQKGAHPVHVMLWRPRNSGGVFANR